MTIAFSAGTAMRASSDAVWLVLTDIGCEPQWMGAVRQVRFVGELAHYAAGAKMRRSGRFLWMDLVWVSIIEDYDPGRLVQFRHTGAIKGESRWEVEPAREGCVVTLYSKGPAPGPLKWLPAIAAYGGRLGLKRDLARLKGLVEATNR